MNFLLMIVVTVVEAIIIYKIRFVYSRKPILAIILSSSTIFIFYFMAKMTINKYVRAYTFAFATINLIFLIIMLVYMWQMNRDFKRLKAVKETDFLLVLGNRCLGRRIQPILMGRLDKAIELYSDFQKKPLIIVSGGKSSTSDYTEAQLMQEYLIENGIPEDKIVLEDQSVNTIQNLEYSSIRIRQNLSKDTRPRVIIVTSDYHIPRTKLHIKKLGIKVQFAAKKTVSMLKWPAMFREFTAIIWYNRYTLATVFGMDILFSLSMCM
ncbi:YdcF family protein [Companilactobacillus halodurans]|uniref:YdcF family protein n=1 Tax=Companilactobacillus halodurans TaxID=2584183 RepID=A0A5P0ZPY0_9LACO|nr:YdcF family protein [Companilactobacillus halodurans]MQS76258.1 YdcF family protein [Companilactobacillus halodurans]MQS96614.1 YdcF family protein [Companilactobacillus halodurans]